MEDNIAGKRRSKRCLRLQKLEDDINKHGE